MNNRYSSVAIVLHWAIAFFIVANLVMGFFIHTLRPPWYWPVLIFHISAGGYIMIALLALHVLCALKHQFIDRVPELARMGLGRRRLD